MQSSLHSSFGFGRLRIVDNVAKNGGGMGVSGANTGGGFGSVYFVATGGSPGSGDIKVADFTIDIDHKYADSGSTVVTGAFYVTN